METSEQLRQLFQKLIDETITTKEVHQLFTYIRHAKDHTALNDSLAQLWGHLELTDYTECYTPEEGGHERLRKNIRLLDRLTDADTPPVKVQRIIEKIAKGHYTL